jgi:Tfp pilus assembly protein FimT
MGDIRKWSETEGARSKFEEFQRALRQARSKGKSPRR